MNLIRIRYLTDIDSLLEYERLWGVYTPMSVEKIVRRMVASERSCHEDLPDTFYEGLVQCQISNKYHSFPQMMSQMPIDIAKSFLMINADMLYVKGEKFDDWMDISVIVPPSVLIAAYYAENFSLCMLKNPVELYGYVKKNLSVFAYTTMLHPYLPELHYWVRNTNGLIDLHIHLNGTTETDAVWAYMLHHQESTIKDFTAAYNKRASIRKLAEQVMPGFTPEKLQTLLQHGKQLQQELLSMIAYYVHNSIQGCTKIDQLWMNFSSNHTFGPLIGEILFLIMNYTTILRTSNSVMSRKLHHYLLIKTIIHRFLVLQHSQVGFPQFQMITENPFRERVERSFENRFMQLMGTGGSTKLQLVEGRFSPKESALKNYQLLSRIEDGYLEACKKIDGMVGGSGDGGMQLALVAHFIKKAETKNTKMVEIRHHFLREELKKKAIALGATMKTTRGRKLIVGVDAAASELDVGPEVFAPAYRYLSRHGIRHFTYHAGEDFRHLLSGIRAIAEAVMFLHLKAGDRIGHGTALGIEPSLWTERVKGICYLSQGEWLDDLVFVWHLIQETTMQPLHASLPLIESAIAELSWSVYGELFLPSVLYQFWLLREFEPNLLLGNMDISEALKLYDYEEIQKCKHKNSDETIMRICRKYHAALSGSVFSSCRMAYDKLIPVEIGRLLSCEQMRIIQNTMLRHLSEKGIVIEVLPTSNLRISYYRNMSEYHVGRWINYKQGETLLPPIVLGSDDPGIFMTNIFNEYARVYGYLSTANYSPVERMIALKQIHENSEIYQFVNHD